MSFKSEQANLESEVNRAVETLIQHCDSVHIFATLSDSESGDTHGYNNGRGNWYARIGQVSDWVEAKRECIRINERKESES